MEDLSVFCLRLILLRSRVPDLEVFVHWIWQPFEHVARIGHVFILGDLIEAFAGGDPVADFGDDCFAVDGGPTGTGSFRFADCGDRLTRLTCDLEGIDRRRNSIRTS
jgi:hypothetical protein